MILDQIFVIFEIDYVGQNDTVGPLISWQSRDSILKVRNRISVPPLYWARTFFLVKFEPL